MKKNIKKTHRTEHKNGSSTFDQLCLLHSYSYIPSDFSVKNEIIDSSQPFPNNEECKPTKPYENVTKRGKRTPERKQLLHLLLKIIFPEDIFRAPIHHGCSFFQCYFLFCTGNVFRVIRSPYQQPTSKSINIIPQDCAIFYLSIESESLLPS